MAVKPKVVVEANSPQCEKYLKTLLELGAAVRWVSSKMLHAAVFDGARMSELRSRGTMHKTLQRFQERGGRYRNFELVSKKGTGGGYLFERVKP